MKLWRQIQLYKKLLLGLWALNVVLIVAGLTFLAFYFQGSYRIEQAYHQHLRRLSALNEIHQDVQALKEKPTWTGQDWLQLGTVKAKWDHELRPLSNPFEAVMKSEKPDLNAVMYRLEEERMTSLDLLQGSSAGLGHYRLEIFWMALLSIVLGWVLPAVLIWRLKRKKDRLQNRLEKQVAVTLRVWKAQSQKFSGEAGRPSGRFWVELTLLTLAQVSKEMDHPAAEYVHHVSQRIFNEMQAVEEGNSNQNSVENGEQVS